MKFANYPNRTSDLRISKRCVLQVRRLKILLLDSVVCVFRVGL